MSAPTGRQDGFAVPPPPPKPLRHWAPDKHAPQPPEAKRRRWRLRFAAVAVLLLIALWAHGSFDRPLSAIGLNAQPCIRYGATFCGSEARGYCRRTAPVVRAVGLHDDCDKVLGR